MYLVYAARLEPGLAKHLRPSWAVAIYEEEKAAIEHVAWAEGFLVRSIARAQDPNDLYPALVAQALVEVSDGEYSTPLGKGFDPGHPNHIRFYVRPIELRREIPRKTG